MAHKSPCESRKNMFQEALEGVGAPFEAHWHPAVMSIVEK